MTALSTAQCYANSTRLEGRTVIITGAGSGFGRALAIQLSQSRANVVLGDVDEKGLAETCALVQKAVGRTPVSRKCDVTSWDDQVALFDLGFKTYGQIDIVLPNAGVSEFGNLDPRVDGDLSKPTPPNLKTLEIDLTAVFYTTRLALWYFTTDKRKNPGLRAIVFTGSMSSFYGSEGPNYGAAKAGILGIQKGLEKISKELSIRVGTVCPYFSKTAILSPDFVHPVPELGFAKVEDVISAFVAAITTPDEKNNMRAWLIPDKHGVFLHGSRGQFIGAEGARRPKAKKEAKL